MTGQYRYIDAEEADEFRYVENQEMSIYERVADEHIGSRRWESDHRLVLQDIHDDTFWAAYYSEGLTEYQDSSGFQVTEVDGQPVVKFTRVNQERVYTYIYTEYEDE